MTPLPNIKTNEESPKKTKSAEDKKELTPLPNLEIKSKTERDLNNSIDKDLILKDQSEKPSIEKNKSFKMDSSFLKKD